MNDPPSPRCAPLPPAVVHPVRHDSEYDEIDPPPKPSVTNHSVVEATNNDDEAGQSPVYTVVKKPLSRAAIAASDEVESVSLHTSSQPTDVTGYQIERVNDSAEQSVEVNTPPRTEEMEILVENTDSGSFDDAVNEIDD